LNTVKVVFPLSLSLSLSLFFLSLSPPLSLSQSDTSGIIHSQVPVPADVKELMKNPRFSLDNPNKVRSLIGAFCSANHVRFHDISGEGYTFLADQIIELNGRNPQIAARLLNPLTSWKKYDPERQEKMKEELQRISSVNDISPDVYEVVKKSL